MATEIDYELLNEMVAKLTIDDDLYTALLEISSAVAEDLEDPNKVLHVVIEAINEKFFRDSRNEKERQWTTKRKRKTFTYVG